MRYPGRPMSVALEGVAAVGPPIVLPVGNLYFKNSIKAGMEEVTRAAVSNFIAKKSEEAQGSPVFFPNADRRGVSRGQAVLRVLGDTAEQQGRASRKEPCARSSPTY